jgi:hypothetical protein
MYMSQPGGTEMKWDTAAVYADNMNLLGENIRDIDKNTVTSIGASKEVDLEEHTENTEYMLLSHYQNAGQNHDMKVADRYFENMRGYKF